VRGRYLLNNTGGKLCTDDSYPYAGPVQTCKKANGVISPVELHSFGA
jgi:hypothetical protein